MGERFDRWCQTAFHAMVPTLVQGTDDTDPEDFRACVRVLDFGAVHVSELTHPPLRLHRTPRLIRRSDPEAYQLLLPLQGSVGLAQSGRQALLRPRDLLLYDTSRPFHSEAADPAGAGVRGMVARFPKAMFPFRHEALDRITAVRLAGDTGMGALLVRHLTELAGQAAHYRVADAARLATVAVDLLAAWCAHHLEAESALTPEAHHRALQTRIHAFVQQRLGDPRLTPDAIAAAHQISTRHLYKLFQEQGLTVAGWIRQRRLERCRRDLADPRLDSRPVHAIAARWGFTSDAHFSRLFRAVHGMTPTEYRFLMRYERGVREPSTAVRGPSRTSGPSGGTLGTGPSPAAEPAVDGVP
ncbi:helix-turn-helix domain-containing protein [Streptomyces sp. URMC 123]|uniref:helix-turn-helix domain-containing protein n=1 Tax=Streptomyces sp. URMC 123 TaxID=3423403 RepID=UPI003F538CE1